MPLIFFESIIRITVSSVITRSFWTHLKIYGRDCKLAAIEWIWPQMCFVWLVEYWSNIRYGPAFHSLQKLAGIKSYFTLWTRNVVSSLPQLLPLHSVYPTVRPNVGYHIIVLVLLFFLYLAPSFTYDASQAVVFHDDRLTLKI